MWILLNVSTYRNHQKDVSTFAGDGSKIFIGYSCCFGTTPGTGDNIEDNAWQTVRSHLHRFQAKNIALCYRLFVRI